MVSPCFLSIISTQKFPPQSHCRQKVGLPSTVPYPKDLLLYSSPSWSLQPISLFLFNKKLPAIIPLLLTLSTNKPTYSNHTTILLSLLLLTLLNILASQRESITAWLLGPNGACSTDLARDPDYFDQTLISSSTGGLQWVCSIAPAASKSFAFLKSEQ